MVIVATIVVKVSYLNKVTHTHTHTEAFCSSVIGCCVEVTTVNATYVQQNTLFSNP
jgi:hypothetical protein